MLSQSVVTILLLFLLSSVNCQSDSAVLELNDENFQQIISQGNYFVMFFAPWCGHCKRLHPIWDKLAEIKHGEQYSTVVIAKVDCTENKEVCSEHEITGYPTLRFFKKNAAQSVKFKDTRDLPAFISFINEQLHLNDVSADTAENPVPSSKKTLTELTEKNFVKYVSIGKHFVKFYAPWCSHCQNLAPTWEKLAKALENVASLTISKIDCTVYRSICQDFEVKGYPTLLWIEDGKKTEKYSGSRELNFLKLYVEKKIGVDNQYPANPVDVQNEKTDENKQHVVQIFGDDFEKLIADNIAFVKFYAPWCGHCQKLSPVWDKLAEKLHISRDNIRIAKVDCTDELNRQICLTEHVEGYPTLNVYMNGKKHSEYGGSRSLPELENYIKNIIDHDEL